MDIEKAIQGLKESGIWDVDNAEYSRVSKIRALISSKFGIQYTLKEIRDYLKLKNSLIEIAYNFFVLKSFLEELLEGNTKDEYKEILENRYVIEIDEKDILNIRIGSIKYTFDYILRYGLDNSYIEYKLLENLEIEESEYTDIYEVIEELQKRGIEIK